MKGLFSALAVMAALTAGATIASATTPAVGAKGVTVGEMLANGQISPKLCIN